METKLQREIRNALLIAKVKAEDKNIPRIKEVENERRS
jgi:hypothetical protein